jgi:hypothetical protein
MGADMLLGESYSSAGEAIDVAVVKTARKQ